MKENIKNHLNHLRTEIEQAGNALRNKPMPELTEKLFSIYEKTGNRLLYENEYFLRRKYLVTFALLSLWYKKADDLKQLEAVIKEICQETTWALPAHVNRTEPNWKQTVDLFASETGQALSEIITVLADDLSDEIKHLVKSEVIYRLIDSYLSKPMGQWVWEHYHNNWCAVCAGSLGSIAMYLLTDDQKKQTIVLNRVLDTLPDYLDGMMDDGTCPEGLSYFTYGMSYYVGFADQLYEFTKGKTDLLENPKVERIAQFQQKCYFSSGNTISFSDGDRNDRFRLGLSCYLALRYSNVEIPDIHSAMNYDDDHCYRWMSNYRDYIWTERFLKEAKNEQAASADTWFSILPSAQWAIGRSKNHCGFAIKGGNNDEPHNHNDIGNFLYIAHGEMFLTDLGHGEYTKDYFHEKRYEILCNRSRGHSVPFINYEEQKVGAQYCTDVFHSAQPGNISISFASAYGQKNLKDITRKLSFHPENGSLSIEDEFQFLSEDSSMSVKENLVTQIHPEVFDNTILLTGKNGTVKITIPSIPKKIEIEKEIFMNHHGKAEDVYLIQWEVPIALDKASCKIYIEAES